MHPHPHLSIAHTQTVTQKGNSAYVVTRMLHAYSLGDLILFVGIGVGL